MNEMYASYLSDDERDFMIIESTFDNVIKQAECLYEMAILKHKMFISDAENKVLCESGTFDDLEILYEEAGASTDKTKEGIIKKIITGIQNFFTNIATKIKNLFTKDKLDKIAADKSKKEINDPKAAASIIDEAKAKASTLTVKIKGGAKSVVKTVSKPKNAVKVVVGGAVAVGGYKMLSGKFDDFKKYVNGLISKVEKDPKLPPDEKQTILTRLSGLVKNATSAFTGFVTSVTSAFGKNKDDKENPADTDNNESKPSDNTGKDEEPIYDEEESDQDTGESTNDLWRYLN